MKRLIANIQANTLFWLDDLVWNISFRLDSGMLFSWYQILMNKSYRINKKYNLNLWKHVKKDQETDETTDN